MPRIKLGLCTAAALGAAWLLACEAAERPAEIPAEPPPVAVPDDSANELREATSLATGAAEAAAESAQVAGNAAESAEALSGEAAGLLTALGFVDDREVIQVLNTKIGTRVVFLPSTIVVTSGTGRKLSIFNDSDMPHGFRIPGLALEALLLPGEENVIELPPLVGPQIYGIECHLHVPHRHATLVVLPARPSGD